MPITFTSETLPDAVASLFRLNNFVVTGPLKVHGAEVDLKAKLLANPFAEPIYIEATVEYVNNEKYGKDATKFLLLREKQPSATFLIVSSTGFSLPVLERAAESRIECLTYDQLFTKFQQFSSYTSTVLTEGNLAEELTKLNSIYEEPLFHDGSGTDIATDFLVQWRDDNDLKRKWLIVVGEYGTGKTALTKVLLHRWMLNYRSNPELPLPIRIELRDFTRQFDAKGLLHHFLDTNDLGHIPVNFLFSLIKSGRVVLLLDGYDEMAQYMHARERRVCLEALAQLSDGGAKGILTSRPNYFADAEELQVLEILYASLSNTKSVIKDNKAVLEAERSLDSLLEAQFINRFERSLQDLTTAQTEALVSRALEHDPSAREVVLSILEKVFRSFDVDASRSLSGKPVIITYLLEVAEELKGADNSDQNESISEWQVYELIIEKLMLRDFRRAPDLLPQQRRSFLQVLGVWLSRKGHQTISEEDFINLIRKEFAKELRRNLGQEREEKLNRYFTDLRSSTTLTRSSEVSGSGWRFSHNSLREFLVADYLLAQLEEDTHNAQIVPVTDAMRIFTASRSDQDKQKLVQKLSQHWAARNEGDVTGLIFCLLWDASLSLYQDTDDPVRSVLEQICGKSLSLDRTAIDRISFAASRPSANLALANFARTNLTDVSFSSCHCENCNFSEAILDGVLFTKAILVNADFRGCVLSDVDFSGAVLTGTDFRQFDSKNRIIHGFNVLEGITALGYLSYNGAITDSVPVIYKLQNHPLFSVADKVARKLVEGGQKQLRGLTQQGAANANPRFARDFVETLVRAGFAKVPFGRTGMVEVTEIGRTALSDMIDRRALHPVVEELFHSWS